MQRQSGRITIRVKLIVALLVVALTPLLILTILNTRTQEAVLTESANRALSAAASQAATSVDVFIETNLDALRVEARLPGLVGFLDLSPEARRSDADAQAVAMRTLQGLIRKDSINILSYALLDRDGRNVLDTMQSNIGADESSAGYFRRAMETGLPYVSEVVFSGGVPQLVFSSLVRDAKNKKTTLGVLRCIYHVAAIQRIILEQTRLLQESDSFAILLDEHHIRLAHGRSPGLVFKSLVPLDAAVVQELKAARRLPDWPVAELSTDLASFDEGVRLFEAEASPGSTERRFLQTRLASGGDGLYAVALARVRAFASHGRPPWTVAFAREERAFLAPIEAKTRRDALALGLLSAAIVTAAALIMAELLTRPVIRLAHAASQLAGGKLDTEVEVRSRDEMGTLARSFNQMTRQLRESFEELEARVEQRTAELKEAKLAADAANKAKSDFLANMSHELRTPLNSILGYAQILRRSRALTEQDRRGVDLIHQSGAHLLTLINDVLDLAKIEAQKMELHPGDLELASFLRSTAEICRIRAEQKGITLVYEPDPRLPARVYADERRLRQVLINLLGNAVKFTEKGGVRFSVTELGDGTPLSRDSQVPESARQGRARSIRFQIEDTGCGIAPDQLEQIFLPFKQAGDGKRQIEGTGLGLSISQRIVNMMGSAIQVKSEPGKGSVFWMDVVLAESTKRVSRSEPTAGRGMIVDYEGPRRKVLVVDDKRENRDVLVTMLTSLGFEAVEAMNGEEGLSAAAAHRPDLIIADVVMPGLDGWEMVQRLRQDPAQRDVTIFISSASVFGSDQDRSIAAGASDFLPKPVQMDELLAKMEQHMKLRWIRAQHDGPGEAGAAPDDAEAPEPSAVAPPSAEDLRALLELANSGLMNQLQRHVDNIEREDPRCGPFARHLRRLLKDARLDAAEEFIKGYMGDSA